LQDFAVLKPDLKRLKERMSTEGWREMTKCDVPSRSFLAGETIALMEKGENNSDRVRNRIRTGLKLIWRKKPSNKATEDPIDEFVNEHAFALKVLTTFHIIELVDLDEDKEYRLLPGAREKLETNAIQRELHRDRDRDRDPVTGHLPASYDK
jgi:hypothetical protein